MQQATETPRGYVIIFVTLITLTGATVALCQFDLGLFHAEAGLMIAAIKSALIFLFFMHMWRSKPLIFTVAMSGLFWLGILLALTMADTISRDLPM